MAKANKWFKAGNTFHKNMGLYKIPEEDRKEYMNYNIKWVSLPEYAKYLVWKENR